MTVLVTGATGNVGSAAVHELRRRGAAVRAFVRDPEAENVPRDVELAVGDFEDPASIRAALDGVERVFLSSADGPRKFEHEAAVVDAATGVELIAKASTLNARAGSPLKPFDWNGRSEEYLRHSSVPSVVLASAFYMSNLLAVADAVRAQAVLPAPAGDGRIAMIDPRDVGAVAAAVLTGSGHAGRTYRLTGPRAISYRDVAAELGVQYIDVPPEVARDRMAASGMPGWLAGHLDGVFALIRSRALEDVTDTVRVLTGRDPRDVGEFLRDHEAAFAPLAEDMRPGTVAGTDTTIRA